MRPAVDREPDELVAQEHAVWERGRIDLRQGRERVFHGKLGHERSERGRKTLRAVVVRPALDLADVGIARVFRDGDAEVDQAHADLLIRA